MSQLSLTSKLTSSSGMEMPVIGLGTWQNTDEEMEKTLNTALELGYRLIDTAQVYKNEEAIGRVLSKWFGSGKLSREDIFITTKLPPMENNPKYVKKCLQEQLKALQVDYVDLYLIHSPVGFMLEESGNNSYKLDMDTDIVALWKELEKQVDSGLTKAIGLSNFNESQIERILQSARILPANLQTELYLYLQCKPLQKFCKTKGITVTSYGTLGSPGAPQGLLQGATYNPLEDPTVGKIAAKHGKTAGQILIRHILQSGIAVIPKSSNPERLRQNLQVFDFELSESEMNELDDLDKGEEGRRFILEIMKPHPEYPHPK